MLILKYEKQPKDETIQRSNKEITLCTQLTKKLYNAEFA